MHFWVHSRKRAKKTLRFSPYSVSLTIIRPIKNLFYFLDKPEKETELAVPEMESLAERNGAENTSSAAMMVLAFGSGVVCLTLVVIGATCFRG